MGDQKPDWIPQYRAAIEAVPPENRLEFLAAQPRDRLAYFKRVLSPQDRTKLNAYLSEQATAAADAALAERRVMALAGTSKNISDMVEVLMEHVDRLSPNQRQWVEDIDQTAALFDYHNGFTARQSEVIQDIYRKHFPIQGR